jgi:hypothetical protein
MKRATGKEALRKKLLGALPRQLLEEVSYVDGPWHCSRSELEQHALANWDDNTMDVILKWAGGARYE